MKFATIDSVGEANPQLTFRNDPITGGFAQLRCSPTNLVFLM